MVAIKKETLDTADLSYFVRRQLEEGYTHFEIELTKDVRTGRPKKDFRRVEVRYWHQHPGFRQELNCPDCDKVCPSTSALDLHMHARKHGPYKEMRVPA